MTRYVCAHTATVKRCLRTADSVAAGRLPRDRAYPARRTGRGEPQLAAALGVLGVLAHLLFAQVTLVLAALLIPAGSPVAAAVAGRARRGRRGPPSWRSAGRWPA